MKRTTFVLATVLVVFVAAFGVLVLRPVPKVRATIGCSNKSLWGNYGLVASGFYGPSNVPPNMPANFSVLLNFTGNGLFTGSSLNITADESLGATNATISGGTYTVNPNCTVTLTAPGGSPFFDATISAWGILADTGGDELSGNFLIDTTGPEMAGTFVAKRVAIGQWVFVP